MFYGNGKTDSVTNKAKSTNYKLVKTGKNIICLLQR